MVFNLPVGVITIHPSERATAILRRMVATDWWESAGNPQFEGYVDAGRPVLYVFDGRNWDERLEARLLAWNPTAQKLGETPSNLLFMTGKTYRLTPLDWGDTDR